MCPIISAPGGISDLPAPDRDVLIGREAEEPGAGMQRVGGRRGLPAGDEAAPRCQLSQPWTLVEIHSSLPDFRGTIPSQLLNVSPSLFSGGSPKQGCVKLGLSDAQHKCCPCTLMTSSPVKNRHGLFIWQKQKLLALSFQFLTVPLELCGGKKGQPTPPNASTGALERV